MFSRYRQSCGISAVSAPVNSADNREFTVLHKMKSKSYSFKCYKMECVPEAENTAMPATTNNQEYYMRVSPTSNEYTRVVVRNEGETTDGMRPAVTIKPRKTNFTPKEVQVLLTAVAIRRDTVLFGVAGGQVWAQAWQDIALEVSSVQRICRTESDVRKKWTYLKWEAKNTSKPDRDPTSKAVQEILTGGDPEASAKAKSLLEKVLVPNASPNSPIPNPAATAPGPSRSPTCHGGPTTTAQPTPVQTQPSEVCVRWNSYHLNMQAVFPSLLSNEQFVDVTLACEGQSIKCHKIILSACSPYFQQLLSQNPCQHPIVLMKDFYFWQVQALVEFMYRGEVNVAQDKLPSLLSAAGALQIKGLAHPMTTTTTNTVHDEDSVPVSSASDPVVTPHRSADEPQQSSLIRNRRRHSSSTPELLRHSIDIGRPTSSPSLQPISKFPNEQKPSNKRKTESTDTKDILSTLSEPYEVKMIKTESPLEDGEHGQIKVKMEPIEIKEEVDMDVENGENYDFDSTFVDEVLGAELRIVEEEEGGEEEPGGEGEKQTDNGHEEQSDNEEQSTEMEIADTLILSSGKTSGTREKAIQVVRGFQK